MRFWRIETHTDDRSQFLTLREKAGVDFKSRLKPLNGECLELDFFDRFDYKLHEGLEYDTLGINAGWLIISKLFREVLEPIVDSSTLQFLEFPFSKVNPRSRSKYYLINSLRIIPCLDLKHSDIGWSKDADDNPYIGRIHECYLKKVALSDNDKIFRIAEYLSFLIIHQTVLDMLVQEGITGFLAKEVQMA